MRRLAALLLAALVAPAASRAQGAPAPTKVEVAEGVYVFRTEPHSDVGLDGNSVAVVTEEGVLIFDSNGTPAAARAVLAELRRITPAPVKYIVHSHWHWDHWYGAEVYREAFPQAQVISHERTRALMGGPAIAFNQPGLDRDLPAHIAQVEQALATARSSGRAADLPRLERHLAEDRDFLAQKRGVHHTLATITFSDSLTIHLGPRTIQVRHHDRAITPGDAYLYLPAEQVLVTGDLLVNPLTFALFCYPSGWLRTLRHLETLPVHAIVPGHGAPLEDRALLRTTIDLLQRELDLAREARGRGLDVDAATKAVLADAEVTRLRAVLTRGNAALEQQFPTYMVAWFVSRAYQELDGTLDDGIPRVP